MAVNKLVDGNQLDSDISLIADAIRTKGGTTAALSFPSGMVQAINDIETHGEPYEGSYTVIPNANSDVVLNTDERFLDQNITVRKIPYESVSNLQGGQTVTIGGY